MWTVIIKVLSLFWDVDVCLFIQRLVLVVIRILFFFYQSHPHTRSGCEDEKESKKEEKREERDSYDSVFNVLIDETADHVDLFVTDAFVVVKPQDDLKGMAVKVVAFDPQFELTSSGKVLAVGVWTQFGEIHVKGVDL